MKHWHLFWSNYFGFNKQQRNGLFVLVLLMTLLFIARLGISAFIHPKPVLIADFSRSDLSKFQTPGENNSEKRPGNEPVNPSLFVFDPNTVSREQLLKLGFREKTATTFLNYRSKGAQFRKKEDLKKVYGISESLYNKLEPFILIEPEKPAERSSAPIKETPEKEIKAAKPLKKTELNSADSLALLEVKGIGPSFTKRILKYRSMLGGFVAIEQLKEVYGMDDETFNTVKDQLTVDPLLLQKIRINSENFKELNRHPYLGYETTKAVFNYRRKNGPIKTAGQLKEIITDEATLSKLLPYLSFE